MESSNFRKLLLIFALILLIPVMNSIYGMISAIITTVLVAVAVLIIIAYFATRKGKIKNTQGITSDINSINIKVNGRSYIISESEAFNTEDHDYPGILSYVEHGIWYLSDDLTSTARGSVAEITVPAGKLLNSLDIDVESGNLLINSVSAKRASINVHNDFAEIKSLNAHSLSASAGSGRLIINTNLSGNASLSCGKGAFDIKLGDSIKNYNIEAATGSGTIALNSEILFNSLNRNGAINNKASRHIKASCGFGKLNINFTEVEADEQN